MLFEPGQLSLGIVLPVQARTGRAVDFAAQIALAERADRLGFSALWVRDVPLNSPDYPDPIGHSDPWVLLGALAVATDQIHLVTGAVVLPLRDPLHVAKAALSLNDISAGRFVLGLGSGDRPSEFSVFGKEFTNRKEIYRNHWPRVASALAGEGVVLDADGSPRAEFRILPRNIARQVPMLAVGSASQSLEWIARNATGWATYHRPIEVQKDRIALWQTAVSKSTGEFRSFSQAMVLDLLDNAAAPAETVNLGYRLGRHALLEKLRELRLAGVHHVMFNFSTLSRPVEEVLDEVALEVMPLVNA